MGARRSLEGFAGIAGEGKHEIFTGRCAMAAIDIRLQSKQRRQRLDWRPIRTLTITQAAAKPA